MINSENPTLNKAIQAIKELFEDVGNVQWQTKYVEALLDNKWKIDVIISLTINHKTQKLLVEVKSSGEPRIIAQAAGYLKRATEICGGYPVLVAPFVSSRGRELCKELGIGFVDLAGNAYIRSDGVLIEHWGKDNPKKEKRIQKSLFSTKGTWVIRTLFNEPKRNWTLMKLAWEAGVSLGQVHKVVNKLSSEGFVEKRRGAITLVKPGELLDEWAMIYRFDNQKIVGYYCPLKDQKSIFKVLTKLPEDTYALTLGAAASLVAPFVRSTDVFIYVRESSFDLKNALHLTPVEFGGNVNLVSPSDQGVFFGTQCVNGLTLVSNFQLYLDLYNYPMRGREQAEHLREKMLGV